MLRPALVLVVSMALALLQAPCLALADSGAWHRGAGKFIVRGETTDQAEEDAGSDGTTRVKDRQRSRVRAEARPAGSPPSVEPLPWTREDWEALTSRLPECVTGPAEDWCAWQAPEPGEPGEPGDPPAAAPPPRQAAEAVVRQVVATLQLPQANPHIGPDPSWNEWNMAVVGHPLWLWTEGPTTLTAHNSDYGISVSLDARLARTVFAMGDGTTISCARTQPYDRYRVKAATPSPVCGHTYQQAPRSRRNMVTATAHWTIDWTAAGHSGTLTTTMTANRDVPVGELQAVVIR